MDTSGEILEVFWKLSQSPEDPQRLRNALAAPPEQVLRCIEKGLLVKAGLWRAPDLTSAGREFLRRYRTCYDCHQECIEDVHECPARQPHNYRDAPR